MSLLKIAGRNRIFSPGIVAKFVELHLNKRPEYV